MGASDPTEQAHMKQTNSTIIIVLVVVTLVLLALCSCCLAYFCKKRQENQQLMQMVRETHRNTKLEMLRLEPKADRRGNRRGNVGSKQEQDIRRKKSRERYAGITPAEEQVAAEYFPRWREHVKNFVHHKCGEIKQSRAEVPPGGFLSII